MRQDGVQIMTHTPPLRAPSPYAVASQALTVQFPTDEVFEYDRPKDATSSLSGETLTFSGIGAAPPFAEPRPVFLRYRSNVQFVHFESVDRDVTVRCPCRDLITNCGSLTV